MSAASLPLQGAVYAALNTALAPTKVYDIVPQDAVFPYVSIGDDAADDWSTLAGEGEDVDFTIHIWSRYMGRKEAKQIMAAAKAALHGRRLIVTGWHTASVRWNFEACFTDPDGITTHGVQRFRALLSR